MADARQVHQYLAAVLSHRGPGELPYAEDDRWLIRHHLASLSEIFPSLRPSASAFTYNDGRTATLLHAEGSIRTSPGRRLPASIWLLEAYPHVPPAVFLRPARGTLIMPGHPHVDSSGAVDAPYLRSWRFPKSNLADLVHSLSLLFNLENPLYTGTEPKKEPAEMKRVSEKVQRDLAGLARIREAEMEGFLGVQAELKRRKEAIIRGMRELEEERENLEQELQIILTNTDVMESWVRETSGKNGRRRWKTREVNVDDVFEPYDEKSRQMMECSAMDLALDDTIYALDRAVTEGCVPFDVYLKNVRALSRDQFFHRSTAVKVQSKAGRMPRHAT
ncbi:protein ELC-like [Phoenix dactylifera]|uniref:Protein ELC-like n=1 Tax=Phoenix dactylifera TaxID=42345 RepID=A0A8B8J1R1_PHODC|nr:protein ELC-like [Phoenix dactylifera]